MKPHKLARYLTTSSVICPICDDIVPINCDRKRINWHTRPYKDTKCDGSGLSLSKVDRNNRGDLCGECRNE